ncbi:cytochrome p450 [Seiridium cupressi]
MINLRRTDEKLKGETLFCDGLNPVNNPPHPRPLLMTRLRVSFRGQLGHASYCLRSRRGRGFLACIKKTLRRDVPAHPILLRIFSEPGCEPPDGRGGKVYAPPGIQMGASPYITHRDEAMFGAAPDVRRPECWIQAESGTSPREHELWKTWISLEDDG